MEIWSLLVEVCSGIKEDVTGWPYPASCSPDGVKVEAPCTTIKEEVLQEVIQWEEQICFEEPGSGSK